MALDVPSSPSGRHPAAQTRISVAGNCLCGASSAPARNRARLTGAVLMTMLTVFAAKAQPVAADHHVDLPPMKVEAGPLIGGPTVGNKSADPCVAVDVAGRKAGTQECAAQKLQDAATSAQNHTDQGRDTANLPTATSHDTKIGVANQTATKQRLGSNFGKSVLPQRPNIPPPAPTPFARHN